VHLQCREHYHAQNGKKDNTWVGEHRKWSIFVFICNVENTTMHKLAIRRTHELENTGSEAFSSSIAAVIFLLWGKFFLCVRGVNSWFYSDFRSWSKSLKLNETAICFHSVTALTALIELTGGRFAGRTAPFAVMCPGHMSHNQMNHNWLGLACGHPLHGKVHNMTNVPLEIS
jgi:hypothetical protein